jgi:hypothetical protein
VWNAEAVAGSKVDTWLRSTGQEGTQSHITKSAILSGAGGWGEEVKKESNNG